ncbi:MAG TPA: Gfo/Idh/MocA family oxidoreductase [bacterium]|nr:Gfo/Idh/MocA family oxidoreductase [bacterium]HNZ73260.1 Gfo/Idh/MocA family oxidoreductase [bacterium]
MTQKKVIPVCIVGGGFGKRVLLPVCELHPCIRVVSLVVNCNIPEDVKNHIPIFTDLDVALRESQPDLVLIASPHALHADQVNTVLESGKHVLCEKPLALQYETASNLSHKCDELGLIGAVDYSFRFIPARAYFTELIRSGEIGAIRIAYLSFFRNDFGKWPSAWYYDRHQGGGMLQATGSHLVDSAQLLLADPVSELTATIIESNGIDTGFTIIMETGDGAVCCIAVSHQMPGLGKHLLEAHGTDGSLLLGSDGTIAKVSNGKTFPCPVPESYFIGFGNEKWEDNSRLQPTARLIDKVVSSILGSTPLQDMNFAVAAANQKLLCAAWESHRSRRRVVINEYK